MLQKRLSDVLFGAGAFFDALETYRVTKIEHTGAGDHEWWQIEAWFADGTARDGLTWQSLGLWRGKDIAHAMNRRRRFPHRPDKVLHKHAARGPA